MYTHIIRNLYILYIYSESIKHGVLKIYKKYECLLRRCIPNDYIILKVVNL